MANLRSLVNTKWQLNSTLVGTNLPAADYWQGTSIELNANLDGYLFSGFAFAQNIDTNVLGRSEIVSATFPTGAFMGTINDQFSTIPGTTQFLADCETIGVSSFELTPLLKKSFYLSMQVTSASGIATLTGGWSSNLKDRICTVYGGTGATNSAVIEWFEMNGTFLGYENSDVPSLFFSSIVVGESKEGYPTLPESDKISYASTLRNKVTFNFKSNLPFDYAQVKVYGPDEEITIEGGTLACHIVGSYAAETQYSLVAPVTSDIYKYGDGVYTLAVRAKNSATGTWSETLFFIVISSQQLITSSGYIFEVPSIVDSPLAYDTAEQDGTLLHLHGAQSLSSEDDEVILSNEAPEE